MNKNFASINSNTHRILAKGVTASNNTWETGLNNNDLIIGPSGAGKTRGYVKPNILQCNESMIIADTKGNLMEQVGPSLKKNGYKLQCLDLKDLSNSTIGYNPLDFVRFDEKRGRYNEQDILLLGEILVPPDCVDKSDPFWGNAAKMYIISMLAYILQCLVPEEHHLSMVPRLLAEMATGHYYELMDELSNTDPESYAVRVYKLFRGNTGAEKMENSIRGIANERFAPLMVDTLEQLYTRPDRLSFRDLGREKTALFLHISDTDRSLDRIASMLYTQALHALCYSADTEYPGQCLPVPVRFILDDFATNAYIPRFQDLTSVIRSRGISVSVILQSITQLSALYGVDNAQTIINNCDHWLYLGGQDLGTASQIARKADKREPTILHMPAHKVLVFARGQQPVFADAYDLKSHPLYPTLPEAVPDDPPLSLACTNELDAALGPAQSHAAYAV